MIQRSVAFVREAATLPALASDSSGVRQLQLLRVSLPMVAPSHPERADELSRTVASMTARFGTSRYRPAGQPGPLDVQGLDRILSESRDPALLQDVWCGWHDLATEQRSEFSRFVELANEGAVEIGFRDTGEMWRSSYEMPPTAFADEVERLWEQVRGLYEALHAFVRGRLRLQYPTVHVPEHGPIPAHLLGNMWAQSWDGLYPLLDTGSPRPEYDLTELLRQRAVGPVDMVRMGERFFTSLGLPPLPPTFWTRSMFERPRDREVICHASAWDLDSRSDLRIKMCIEITGEDFRTIHHELGHNFYQRAYQEQPFLLRGGAHDGFHEAIGDTIALSVTPEYLVQIGLLKAAPGPESDLDLLLRGALNTVAFLPFGLLVDRWRWKVFSGEIGPPEYNTAWWALARKYQGIGPAGDRSDSQFDAGSKFHVVANTPYMRYFLAAILQYQFHRALARTIGWTGPLHRCSIYARKDAGERLTRMLEMGMSRPWPEALEAITGERRMDAGALLEYYAPLKRWLDEQNRGTRIGW